MRQKKVGQLHSYPLKLKNFAESIKSFLTTFKSDEKDLTHAIADLNVDDDHAATELASLKYMRQLVSCRAFVTRQTRSWPLQQQRIANRDQQMLVIELEDIHTVRSQNW